MTKYAAGIASVLEGASHVEAVRATNLNMPVPFRWLFPRYRGVERMPRRWTGDVDLVHFTDVFVAPHAGRFRCVRVSTLHDMIPMEHARIRRVVSLRWRLAFLRSLKSLRHSNGIIVPSENTRREYLETVGDADSARLHVVPVLVPDFVQPPPPGSPRETRTILSVGTAARYKNLPVLLHALAQPALAGARIVRVGSAFEREHHELAERLGIASRIEHHLAISEEQLLRFYQTATVLVQPSLTEGFGMPVAEAMAAGLPVVTSDGGALPEVVGAAGRVVPFREHHAGKPNLDDARDFGEALAQVLADVPGLNDMSRSGLQESRRFRAPNVRERLLDAYARAAIAHGG